MFTTTPNEVIIKKLFAMCHNCPHSILIKTIYFGIEISEYLYSEFLRVFQMSLNSSKQVIIF